MKTQLVCAFQCERAGAAEEAAAATVVKKTFFKVNHSELIMLDFLNIEIMNHAEMSILAVVWW